MPSDPEAWEKFLEKLDALNCCTLIIEADSSLQGGIASYKVYVNGNIHCTGNRFKSVAPPNSVYSPVPPGSYRVVLRDYDHAKPNRRESNTLKFVLIDNQELKILASDEDGRLKLSF